MCLFSSRKPDWEEDVVFANRRRRHSHSHHRRSHNTRVISETIIHSRPTQQYISAPPTPPPVQQITTKSVSVHTPSPPPAPPSPPSPARVELVSVEEDIRRSSTPRTSVSVSTHKKSRHGGSSRGGEEVYIERERERVRLSPQPIMPSKEEFDTYRYVQGSGHMETMQMEQRDLDRRRRSITYSESGPRISGRVTERERVVIEGDGRRKEYYRRP
ncbi:hypothetical protein WAI453_007112 [Rhynchosporium graminicola]|uniref:Uncharacterized protein n=1 Tax=Rhynchosporium graminicola TaxID=2792576 RepID=A0A1E1LHM6_9HELO|nr:uncharacterized protein RCO7_02245 [Rhynchosporium commune]